MKTLQLSSWIAVLIKARLLGLTEQELAAKAVLTAAGFNLEFASDLTA